ncbi:hypothetical protein CKA32_000776 [Geitlerinema sp. FC II]|nr:hypothetical protein CKA32_000064 [Geitlerinema sp. FC II]PPT05375.1 hypothetical protein CKA32_000776 [Geitlerinema sp. FC II]
MHLKNVNLSDRSLYSELSCYWVKRSLHLWTAALPKSNRPQTHIFTKVRCTHDRGFREPSIIRFTRNPVDRYRFSIFLRSLV